MPHARNAQHRGILWLIVGWIVVLVHVAHGQSVILELRNGDRISGKVISESTNQLVLSTAWVKELAIPLVEIKDRKIVPDPAAAVMATNAPPTVSASLLTNVSVANPGTNTTAAKTVAATKPPVKKQSKLTEKKSWSGKVDIGADLGFNAATRELYYGRAKITYAPPTPPGQMKSFSERFKNTFDLNATYGRMDGVLSANRLDTSSKTEFDIGKRVFVYNLIGAGYDEIRLINYEYEVGPGIGYRLITRTNLALNTELGMTYQLKNLDQRAGSSNDDEESRFLIRIAENGTWSISQRITVDQKFEFFPSIEDLSDFRLRFETNLRYALWQNGAGQNLYLALTLLDTYETRPARGVSRNDLQIRSSIGINF